jgi:hypothetical protein
MMGLVIRFTLIFRIYDNKQPTHGGPRQCCPPLPHTTHISKMPTQL